MNLQLLKCHRIFLYTIKTLLWNIKFSENCPNPSISVRTFCKQNELIFMGIVEWEMYYRGVFLQSVSSDQCLLLKLLWWWNPGVGWTQGSWLDASQYLFNSPIMIACQTAIYGVSLTQYVVFELVASYFWARKNYK